MALLSFQLALLKSVRKPHIKAAVPMLCSEVQARRVPDWLLLLRPASDPQLHNHMLAFHEASLPFGAQSRPGTEMNRCNGQAYHLPPLWPKLEAGNGEGWSWGGSAAFSLNNWTLSLPQRLTRLGKLFKSSSFRVVTLN